MSLASLAQFRELVLREPSIQVRLREPLGLSGFMDLMLQEGKERGFDFTAEEIQQALNASRRAWLERWI